MKQARPLLLAALVLVAGVATSMAGRIPLHGEVRDNAGEPVGGILIRLSAGGLDIETRSVDDGSYSAEVPDLGLPWTVTVDAVELIALGYFCVPGFIWDPELGGGVPPLTAVPLRPEISFERSTSGIACVRLSFDWASGITPSVLRQYRIERSTDAKSWSEVMRIALACPPIEFFDETQTEERSCYYRAVPIDSVIVSELDPGDFEFIADPAIGWEGDPLLVFNEGDPLPDSPIVAPEIILRPEAGGE